MSIPFVRGSATSEAAALSQVTTSQVDEARVLDYIQRCLSWGATDDEIEQGLGMLHQTASARRRGLVLKGLVIESGRMRPTRSGRDAIVWIPKPASNAPAQTPMMPPTCAHGELRPRCILCRTRR